MPQTKTIGARAFRTLLRKRGYNLVRTDHRKADPPVDADEHTRVVIKAIENHTLTPHGRVISLVDSVRYIVQREVPGAIVECGVWRGGSMMAAAMTLVEQGDMSRDLYLFDTFTHMPPAGPEDVKRNGRRVSDIERSGEYSPFFEYIPLDAVRAAMFATGYPEARIHFVPGLVEDTLPSEAPTQIALCRLDTDYYQSTKHEMEHLYPRIASDGVLLIDDYGEFLGARKAVDEYFAAQADPAPFLHRIDHAARLILKP